MPHRLECVRRRWFEYPGRTLRLCCSYKESECLPCEPTEHALGRTRGVFGSKLHLVTARQGAPLGALMTVGQSHESMSFGVVMDTVNISHLRRSNNSIESAWIHLGSRTLSSWQCDGTLCWLLQCCCGFASRYETLAIHFMGIVKLAMIQSCLRLHDPSNRT